MRWAIHWRNSKIKTKTKSYSGKSFLRSCRLLFRTHGPQLWQILLPVPYVFFQSLFLCIEMNGLPGWYSDKKSIWQCRRCSFDLWVGKIPWNRKWQPTPVFLPGRFQGQRRAIVHWVAKSRTWLSDLAHIEPNKCR